MIVILHQYIANNSFIDVYTEAQIKNHKYSLRIAQKHQHQPVTAHYPKTESQHTGLEEEFTLVKRSCKLGIALIAKQQHTDPITQYGKAHGEYTKIHMLLDELDMTAITQKRVDFSNSGDFGKGFSITASELRCMYRLRKELSGFIHFYDKGREVSAPWEQKEFRELWRDYDRELQ